MPTFDRTTAGALSQHNFEYDRTEAGALYPHQMWWDRTTAGALSIVYSSEKYIVRNRSTPYGWSVPVDQNWGVEGVPWPVLWQREEVGCVEVASLSEEDYIKSVGFSTTVPIDVTPYTKMTFTFTRWARDTSDTGYYRTTAGIFSNRIVGTCGNGFATRPASMLAGWLVTDIYGGTQTVDISNVNRSVYFGLSSGGGPRGRGNCVVSDIRLHN